MLMTTLRLTGAINATNSTIGKEFRELCADLKNMYDSLSSVVLLGASVK